ncbi:LysR family transcriptional regulator [Tardiphaga sp. P9-11]|uniref:LysR family transcriptional regulator n=1 Tax=Tardiphaga sp. P9-11 TaxID=2024614 RepID=UPI0011F12560|nr:LysR family transcriptional regulator [Tardiphaga sp. P9-11]KAA0075900.1 LysR family transcriptional regulator [Tardiphaga sp. P9-11]
MDRLAPLNAFIQAAEHRSFTTAGRELGISASAVGKAVSRLEDRLGVQLFHRSTRKITLTSEGASFLKRCQLIFSEIEAAEAEIAQSTLSPRGKLKVSMPAIGMLLMPSLSAFAEAHPNIELELDFSDRLVDVIEEGFDAVMRTGKVSDSRLKIRSLGTYSYVIVGSPAYLKKRAAPKTPEELAQHACLFHRWAATGKLERWQLSRGGADIEVEPAPTIVANTMEPLIDMAERGLGLMYTPVFTVRRQLASGMLVSVLDEYLRATGTLQIIWPSNRHPAPKVKAFVDFMAKNLFVVTA